MMNINQLDVEDKIIEIRKKHVIIDSDVAQLYGVETKRINEAVSRNPEKFPEGYFVEQEVVANCDHLASLKFSPNLPKAFTEKGLYMLATLLKSLDMSHKLHNYFLSPSLKLKCVALNKKFHYIV